MIAVLAGASGLVGSHLLQKLILDASFSKIVCLVRRPLNTKHSKIEEVLTSDFSSLKVLEKQLLGDVYFCCLGTTIKVAKTKEAFRKVDYDSVLEFGRVAQANKANSFIVVSSMGASESSLFFYSRVKGEAERALEKLGLERLVIFRPSLLVGERVESRLAEKAASLFIKGINPILPTSIEKRMKTEVTQLASKMKDEALAAAPGLSIFEASEI